MNKKPNINQLIEEEYLIHNEDEDDELYLMKEALKYALNPLERKIFITYTELGTYADTAKAFNVSIPTVSKYVGGLRQKIAEYVDNNIRLGND